MASTSSCTRSPARKLNGSAPRPAIASRKPATSIALRSLKPSWWPGRDAEQPVGRMVRPRLDAAEAAPAGRIGGAVEVQLVEALLAEDERALGAVDLEVVLHLAAHGDPARLDRAGRAAREAQEGAADVVGLDGAAPAAAVGTARDDGDAVAEHRVDRAEQVLGGRQRMAADVGERAAADRIVAEAERALARRPCSPRRGRRDSCGSRRARPPRSSRAPAPSIGLQR